MAAPKVFQGPAVNVQDAIVVDLEDIIGKRSQKIDKARGKIDKWDRKYYGKSEKPKAHTPREDEAHLTEFADRTMQLPQNLAVDVLYLGSIVLTHIPPTDEGLGKLIEKARLVHEADHAITGSPDIEIGEKSSLARSIIGNTIHTMRAAGQIEYLRKSGIVGGEWQVVVEIHYYRNRPRSQANLHKDTRGQTLFVNLNYTNKQSDAGPEFLISPPSIAEHERSIAATLPGEFLTDLAAARKANPFDAIVKTEDLPQDAVVSFVDEAIHHATPLVGNRTVAVDQLRTFLAKDVEFADLFPVAAAAYLTAVGEPGSADRRRAFGEALGKVGSPTKVGNWYTLMKICAGHQQIPEQQAHEVEKRTANKVEKRTEKSGVEKKTKKSSATTRPVKSVTGPAKERKVRPMPTEPAQPLVWPASAQLVSRRDLVPPMSNDQVDRLLTMHGSTGFNSVAIAPEARADAKDAREPIVDPESRQPIPLTRQMSRRALADDLPSVDPAPRRFFRTWVRAVRVGQ